MQYVTYEPKFEPVIKSPSMIARGGFNIGTYRHSSYVEYKTVVIYE